MLSLMVDMVVLLVKSLLRYALDFRQILFIRSPSLTIAIAGLSSR